jgi:short-subunit dehydrogenase
MTTNNTNEEQPGHTVTVFGATGQLGRYIVNRLARQGCTVVVPYREEMAKRHLKVTGDLGRVVFIVRFNCTKYFQELFSNLVLRSTIFETPLQSRPVCDTRMLFST